MLNVKGLRVSLEEEETEILRGVDLTVAAGEVHAVMGPNGSGKSTLSHVLAGRDGYEVTGGTAQFQGEDLLEMEPEERAAAGLFLAFQNPIELPGVNNLVFLRTALNAQRRARGEDEVKAGDFLRQAREVSAKLNIGGEFLKRSVNAGFSGGEKKRNEILQMTLLAPKLCVMDETDSGLDIDALRLVAEGVNRLRAPDRGFVVITHYQRLLEYIRPDVVHVMAEGRLVETGGPELALRVERDGYAGLQSASPQAA